jgi:hypothetical protein
MVKRRQVLIRPGHRETWSPILIADRVLGQVSMAGRLDRSTGIDWAKHPTFARLDSWRLSSPAIPPGRPPLRILGTADINEEGRAAGSPGLFVEIGIHLQ